ncbi:hypothetical protein [Kineococcus aurantiacus]|uniref:Uncharacterized protein n=1 Tax=Kineococcus aurantiacus TaxID=37633 RepID=A0A7Y9DMG7_9ACTN|nr:hypothetical protein [Kineococcus aurantiacus]NYD23306.1 hypothetical protein [Kineococcus aurantiacus]
MPRRWVPAIAPDDTGVPAHGPLLLSQASGIRAELDHVQAHARPAGLMLHLRLHADGPRAETARWQMIDGPRQKLDPAGGKPPGSEPVLRVALNDLADQVHAKTTSMHTFEDTTTNEVRFVLESSYWINELPVDGRMHVSFTWPQTGLSDAAHTLVLTLPT